MLTKRLAQFVVDTDTRDVPAEVLEGARNALIDTIGCALAGTLEPVSGLVACWIEETGACAQATIWGRHLKSSPAEAAFANGVASHALDFDDTMAAISGHPSATLVPAALAVGEVAGSSGEAVLAAFALGLEVAGKLGRAVGSAHKSRGWHTTAIIGAFSATAVAARLWGLNAAALQTAWGMAASQVSGLMRNFGTMTKPFHAGHAARSGVLSAWMARHGFTADTSIFDGDDGFLFTYGSLGEPLGAVLEQLGKPWEMLDPGIFVKRWPCCHCNHRPVGGILKLLDEHGISTEEVDVIEIGFLPGTDNALVSKNPLTGLEGKFSIEYVAAATLLDRKLTLETFTDPMVQRPQIRELMAKVRRYRIEDSKVYSGVTGYTDVAIATRRGRFTVRVERTPGSPAWPMTEADRTEKFINNAGRVLGESGAQHLLDLLCQCRMLSDVALLIKRTIPLNPDKPEPKR